MYFYWLQDTLSECAFPVGVATRRRRFQNDESVRPTFPRTDGYPVAERRLAAVSPAVRSVVRRRPERHPRPIPRADWSAGARRAESAHDFESGGRTSLVLRRRFPAARAVRPKGTATQSGSEPIRRPNCPRFRYRPPGRVTTRLPVSWSGHRTDNANVFLTMEFDFAVHSKSTVHRPSGIRSRPRTSSHVSRFRRQSCAPSLRTSTTGGFGSALV